MSGLPQASDTCAIKLASIAAHADEATGPGSHEFDLVAIRALLQDPEVVEFMAALDALALLPKKRT